MWGRRRRRCAEGGGGRHQGRRGGKGRSCTMAELCPGRSARVVSMPVDEAAMLQKLLAFGILPGIEVRLIQRLPSIVVQVGHTQLAMDDQLARAILVETPAGEETGLVTGQKAAD